MTQDAAEPHPAAIVEEPRAEFVWHLRVYYEDTDAGGVVYHASYLRFMERARTEWLRALGYGQRDLAATAGVLFAVRRMAVDFLKPARLDDALAVSVRIEKLGAASIDVVQEIVRADTRLLQARVKLACLDATTFEPRPIPDFLKSELHDAV